MGPRTPFCLALRCADLVDHTLVPKALQPPAGTAVQYRIPDNRVLVIVSLIVILALYWTEDDRPHRPRHPYLTFLTDIGQSR